MKNGFFFSLAVMTLWPALAFAQGGPPMITDDPYTVGANKWEINIAMLTIANSSSWTTQVPYFDVNYGVGDQIQLKYESGVSSVINTAIPYGGAYANGGVRWKFYEDKDEGFAFSTYPQYSFYPAYYGKNSSVNTSETSLLVPFEFSKKFGDYAFNPEIGYGFVNGDDNYWIVGLLLAREISKSWSVMVEWHEQIPVSINPSLYIFNIGTTHDFSDTFSLLASVGTTVATSPWFWINYLGIQVHL